MLELLRKLRKVKRTKGAPVQWGARRVSITGRLVSSETTPGQWELVDGTRRVPVHFNDALEVRLAGDWSRGRVEYRRTDGGYVLRSGDVVETLASLAERAADVRQVRS